MANWKESVITGGDVENAAVVCLQREVERLQAHIDTNLSEEKRLQQHIDESQRERKRCEQSIKALSEALAKVVW